MDEATDAELRRRRLRAWRRGTREMDLILGPFADTRLSSLSAHDQALFDRLLSENDHDLYLWLTARIGAEQSGHDTHGPAIYGPILDQIAAHATEQLQSTRPVSEE